ncbi:MAG: glycogen synthase GlgA [bacterium]
MKILMAASEMAPYAKTGGLGDVLGALPRALAREGHQVLVMLPLYQSIDLTQLPVVRLPESLKVEVGGKSYEYRLHVLRDRRRNFRVVFVQIADLFDRPGLYVDQETGEDFVDNDIRFVAFSRTVLDGAGALDFQPDVVHVHDWQTAFVPALLKIAGEKYPHFARTKTVLTIHNLAHQGTFPGERFAHLDVPPEHFAPGRAFEFYKDVNLLKAGIVFADKITTVSNRYAQEIQTGKFGCGLDGVLRQREADIVGILNGVDYAVWSPSRDRHIPYRYLPANLGGKKKTRVELMNEAGLPIRDNHPLIGIVSRLAHQKGFDLIEEAADRLFERDLQMVVLGTGDEKYHRLFEQLQAKYPDKLRCYFRMDERLAHMIEAGSDIFLMPSLFEPCGLNQMYSLKYGTVPIVHTVGGLADTIKDFDQGTGVGNGFVFDEESPEAMLETIDRALVIFAKRRTWYKVVKNGMLQDHSWNRAVAEYVDLYHQLLTSA